MEDLTSNWLWYGELRPLSGPGARRQWSPERTEAQRKQALTRWQLRQQCGDGSRDGRRWLCVHALCLQKQA